MRAASWAVAAALATAACSSGDPSSGSIASSGRPRASDDDKPGVKDAGFDSTPAPDSGLGVLSFSPEKTYSGFDGSHTFKVPIAVYDAGDDLEVTATDPAAAMITPVSLAEPVRDDGSRDNGKYFMVTVRSAGTITLVAASRGKTARATITATAYTTAAYALGEKRYTTAGESGDPPCTQCHAGSRGIDHSPAAMASADDEKLAAVITTGISTSGFPIREASKGHRWQVSDDERRGLVTYLRGLEPRGFE